MGITHGMFVGSSGRIDMIAAYRDHPIPPQTIGKVVFFFCNQPRKFDIQRNG